MTTFNQNSLLMNFAVLLRTQWVSGLLHLKGLAWKPPEGREHISLIAGPQGMLCDYTQIKTLEREHWEESPTSVPIFSQRAFFPCFKKKKKKSVAFKLQQFEMSENWEFVMSLWYSKRGKPVFQCWDTRFHFFFLYLPNR